jgi:hypothetical protein
MGLHRTQAPDLGTGRGPQMDTCGSTNPTDLRPRFAYGSPPTCRSQFRHSPIFNQGQAPELVYELVIDTGRIAVGQWRPPCDSLVHRRMLELNARHVHVTNYTASSKSWSGVKGRPHLSEGQMGHTHPPNLLRRSGRDRGRSPGKRTMTNPDLLIHFRCQFLHYVEPPVWLALYLSYMRDAK